jgi:predicted nucleic acid-binding protein
MPVKRFLDTNILLYAYDLDAPEKRAVAMEYLNGAWTKPGSVAVSVQVLQEFYVNFTRKGYPDKEARLLINDFCQWPVIDNSLTLFGHGLRIREQSGISLWDAMIIAAAVASGAKELLTEDLNHGQIYANVRAVNPFKAL